MNAPKKPAGKTAADPKTATEVVRKGESFKAYQKRQIDAAKDSK